MHRSISKPPTNHESIQNYQEINADAASTSSDESTHNDDEIEEEEDEDDEKPVWTFRVGLLGSISCLILFILNKYFFYQTAECIMSMVTAIVLLYPIGYIMGKFLPKRRILVQRVKMEIALNPGPFDIKEYVLISIFANAGAAYGGINNRYIPHLLP